MAIDLLKTVQKNLGSPELKPIDPNTEEPTVDNKPNANRLAQAVVPSVLAGIYKLAKSEQGIKQIASETGISDWMDIIFAANKQEVLKNILEYTFYNKEAIEEKMNIAATETIKLIRENCIQEEGLSGMKNFISSQRNNILPYLPPALHIGGLLDDTTIDDSTTKMEGPVSTLMHKIASGFTGSETQEEADNKHSF